MNKTEYIPSTQKAEKFKDRTAKVIENNFQKVLDEGVVLQDSHQEGQEWGQQLVSILSTVDQNLSQLQSVAEKAQVELRLSPSLFSDWDQVKVTLLEKAKEKSEYVSDSEAQRIQEMINNIDAYVLKKVR